MRHWSLSAMLFQIFWVFFSFKIKVFNNMCFLETWKLGPREAQCDFPGKWRQWSSAGHRKLWARQLLLHQCLVPEIQTVGVLRCEGLSFPAGPSRSSFLISLMQCELSHCLCSSAGKARVQRDTRIVKHSADLQAVKYHKTAGVMTLWEKLAEGDNKKHSRLS